MLQMRVSRSAVNSSRIAVQRCPLSLRATKSQQLDGKRTRERMIVRVAEETTEQQPESIEPSPEASTTPSAPEPEPSPMERARRALDAETLDKSSLEAALAELEAEMGRLQESAAGAEARASALDATVATAKDQLLRLNADFDNFRRRTQTEKDQLADSVRGDVVVSLLPVVDNFELARTQVKAETEAELKINNSYQSLYKQFVEFLRSLGVEAVATVGTPFDPNIHEAIMKEANSEVPDETVLMEFRKGFKLGDKLLRPAMVKVSLNEFPPKESQEE